MAVGCDEVAQRRIARLGPPGLSKADEKSLVGSEAVQYRARFTLKRQPVGVVRGRQAGKIGDVLTQRLMSIDG